MSVQTGIRRDKNTTASALFGVAVIQLLVGIGGWYLYSGQLGLFDRIVCFSGAFYILLGIAARWFRFPAALIGALLYAAFLAIQASQSVDLLMTGLIFKIPIVILLLLALISALRNPPVTSGGQKV